MEIVATTLDIAGGPRTSSHYGTSRALETPRTVQSFSDRLANEPMPPFLCNDTMPYQHLPHNHWPRRTSSPPPRQDLSAWDRRNMNTPPKDDHQNWTGGAAQYGNPTPMNDEHAWNQQPFAQVKPVQTMFTVRKTAPPSAAPREGESETQEPMSQSSFIIRKSSGPTSSHREGETETQDIPSTSSPGEERGKKGGKKGRK